MPELPEVELYRRRLAADGLHRRLRALHAPASSLLHESSPQALGHVLKGVCFESARRHGKYLFALLPDGRALVLHFGMSGALTVCEAGADPPGRVGLELVFEDGGRVLYTAVRKLGHITLAESPEAFVQARGLGPDALHIDLPQFMERARGRRGAVKSWLMSQSNLAGLGNLYSDEVLFQAGVRPTRAMDTLSRAALAGLHRALAAVLEPAIAAGAQPTALPAGFLLPRRQAGGRCPRCDGPLSSARVAGRKAWFCPHCQPD